MTATSTPSASATNRPLALRMRPDLECFPQTFAQRRFWGIKDPLSQEYYQLRDEEFAVLRMLDGRTSLEELKRRFEKSFAPVQISLDRLQAFLGNLHREGLILSDVAGQGETLLQRHRERRWHDLSRRMLNVLAIRWRGIDPEGLLWRLYPKCRWMFSPWCVSGCLMLVLAALSAVMVRYSDLQARLPELGSFFTASNIVWMAIALAVAKVLHELAHALTCKHFGGECHELGVLLLVFTPCLYCNVSDAWQLPNKWHRVAISAAGIYVEVVLAALCTFLWWFSHPGFLNTLCLNVMFVCSISTLLFNGNPLLRYDGYYIFSDLLGVPNLTQQSSTLLKQTLARWCLGMDIRDDLDLPAGRRGWVAVYAVASLAYRWIVVLAILWVVRQALSTYRMQFLSDAITGLTLGGMLMGPLMSVISMCRDPWRARMIKRGRVLLTCALLGLVLAAIGMIPVPFRIKAPVVIEPRNARRVYVSVPGILIEQAAVPGDEVRQDQPLGRLENLDIKQELAELTGEFKQLQLHVNYLDLRRAEDATVASQIPAAMEALADLRKRLEQRREDEQKLLLKSPVRGTVLPPPQVSVRSGSDHQLARWSGYPTDRTNQETPLEIGTLYCLVGDPSQVQAVLVISQADIQFARAGQRVLIQLDQYPGTVFTGRIEEISRADLEVAPRELAASGGDLPTRTDKHGDQRPLDTSYQARVQLDTHRQTLLLRARGQAKLIADPQPFGRRILRYLRRTFHFEL